MNKEIHIDMEETTTALAERLSRDTMFQAICNGEPRAMRRLEQQGSINIPVDLRKETPLGQRQVESLLRFMVSKETERAFEEAEGDNKVYDALGEHRILGKKSPKKKGRTLPYGG